MKEKTRKRWFWILLVIVTTAIVGIVGCRNKSVSGEPVGISNYKEIKVKEEARMVTLDGYDSESNTTVQTINLWKNYDTRPVGGVAGTVKHGEKAKMIKREGDGVLVETSGGVSGWVTYYFIKELKNE